MTDTLDEARRFLGLPRSEPAPDRRPDLMPAGSPEAARRLWAMSRPIGGTVAAAYLRTRGIADMRNCTSLRFHPRCFYRAGDEDSADHTRDSWPALIAAVTDLDSAVTGVHRTWLDPSGGDKAPISTPRRAMGHLLGHGVRFGRVSDVVAAGEGIETMLSLRTVVPSMPMVAALSSNHLAALVLLPAGLRRLYIARDGDAAGHRAAEALTERAQVAGIEAFTLASALGDFNDGLKRLGSEALADEVRVQLAPEDVARFWTSPRSSREGSGAVWQRGSGNRKGRPPG